MALFSYSPFPLVNRDRTRDAATLHSITFMSLAQYVVKSRGRYKRQYKKKVPIKVNANQYREFPDKFNLASLCVNQLQIGFLFCESWVRS